MSEFIVDELNCTECPLHETSIYETNIRRSGVYGRGNGSSGLWFYGEALGAEEINLGSPFVGESGNLLSSVLRDVGIDENECYITNSVRCRPPANRTPKVPEIRKCMELHALKDVPKNPAKLIVTLGNVPLKAVLNLQKITENRGQFFDSELFNCKVLPTFHPSAILRDPRRFDTFKSDITKARDYIHNVTEKPLKRHKELINSKESFLRCIAILAMPEVTERYCDLETTGLSYQNDIIASISFSTYIDGEYYSFAFLTIEKEGWWYADLTDPEIRDALQKVLLFPIFFHNGLFDVKFFWEYGFKINFGGDTIDQHLLIDENSPHNLRYLISIYNKSNSLDNKDKFKDLEFEEGEFWKAPPELLLDINSDDTFNGLLLKQKFTDQLKKDGLDTFYNKIQMPFKRVLTKMSYRGIMMDREGIKRLSEEYRKKIKQKEAELFDAANQRFVYTSTSKELPRVLFKDLGLPILKRSEVTNSPSTDKEVLEELSQLHTVPKLIMDLRFYKGMIQKYLDGDDLSDEVNPNLGMLCCLDNNDRIHGNFLSFGTISGRPSCTKPNLLNIPKNPEIRQLFIAPPGWKLIELDYSQAELVLLAYLSGDEGFIRDVKSTDFHTATAKSLMKQEVIDDIVRRKAKAINFLKSYGGGKRKLAKQLKITEDEAQAWLDKWDAAYPLVPIYKDNQAALWRSQGYITGIYGRKKRFPPALTREIESYYDRISVNFMCQNGVGDAINSALVDIDYLFTKMFGWSTNTMYNIPGIVLTVYDSIVAEAPEQLAETVKDTMLTIMSFELPKLNISLKTDTTITDRWGEKLEKVTEPEIEEGGIEN